jgi:hydroxymethylpyrimidine pyrophosphatase-like HAD family hydrolase
MPAPPRPIRLVVTDVDGTLVTHARTLAPSTVAAAARLRAAGVRLALVSSRPAHGLDVLLAPLGIDTPRAGFNGGEILDTDDRLIEQHTIPEAACHAAVAYLEREGRCLGVQRRRMAAEEPARAVHRARAAFHQHAIPRGGRLHAASGIGP